jgi:hypothetical protein
MNCFRPSANMCSESRFGTNRKLKGLLTFSVIPILRAIIQKIVHFSKTRIKNGWFYFTTPAGGEITWALRENRTMPTTVEQKDKSLCCHMHHTSFLDLSIWTAVGTTRQNQQLSSHISSSRFILNKPAHNGPVSYKKTKANTIENPWTSDSQTEAPSDSQLRRASSQVVINRV